MLTAPQRDQSHSTGERNTRRGVASVMLLPSHVRRKAGEHDNRHAHRTQATYARHKA